MPDIDECIRLVFHQSAFKWGNAESGAWLAAHQGHLRKRGFIGKIYARLRWVEAGAIPGVISVADTGKEQDLAGPIGHRGAMTVPLCSAARETDNLAHAVHHRQGA